MSHEFVKYTQFKPFIQLDENTKNNITLIEESGTIHLIYACPDGHLHASDNCGVPTTISKCNYATNGGLCANYVGGLYHMLVPGNYVVKHDGYSPAALYYGYFPVYTYKMYEQIYKQAKEAIQKYDSSSRVLSLGNLLPMSENIDESITAKKYTGQTTLRTDNNVACFVCAENFSKTGRGRYRRYNTNVQGPNELYMLPCGHLIHKGCLATARGLNEDDFDFNPNNINDEVGDVSGRVCPYTTCNRNRFLFGSKQSLRANQTVRKRSYVKLAGSIRLNRIRTNKRSKKRSINKYRFGAVNKVGPPPTQNNKDQEKAPPPNPNEKTNKKNKKFTKGYITWNKWQEELKENGKRKEFVLDNKKEVVLREIDPLASEIKEIKRR
jgi:hypothetical protein